MLGAGASVAVDRGVRATLARLLKAVDVTAVDEQVGRAGGVLLRIAGTKDAVDIVPLAAASGRSIHIVPC